MLSRVEKKLYKKRINKLKEKLPTEKRQIVYTKHALSRAKEYSVDESYLPTELYCNKENIQRIDCDEQNNPVDVVISRTLEVLKGDIVFVVTLNSEQGKVTVKTLWVEKRQITAKERLLLGQEKIVVQDLF